MPKQQRAQERRDQVGQWVRTGLVSVTIAKPIVDLVRSAWAKRFMKEPPKPTPRNAVEAVRAKIEEQIPLTQAQFEALTKAVSDRLNDVSHQARDLATKVARVPARLDKRVWWATGLTVGFVAASTAAFVITRRRLHAPAADELVEIATGANGSAPSAAGDRLRGIVNRITRRNATQSASATAAVLETDPAVIAQALFIGNVHTMIYHPKTSDRLPSDANRIYFRTKDEAEAAGYRPANGE